MEASGMVLQGLYDLSREQAERRAGEKVMTEGAAALEKEKTEKCMQHEKKLGFSSYSSNDSD
jgi:hypothetical protein